MRKVDSVLAVIVGRLTASPAHSAGWRCGLTLTSGSRLLGIARASGQRSADQALKASFAGVSAHAEFDQQPVK